MTDFDSGVKVLSLYYRLTTEILVQYLANISLIFHHFYHTYFGTRLLLALLEADHKKAPTTMATAEFLAVITLDNLLSAAIFGLHAHKGHEGQGWVNTSNFISRV